MMVLTAVITLMLLGSALLHLALGTSLTIPAPFYGWLFAPSLFVIIGIGIVAIVIIFSPVLSIMSVDSQTDGSRLGGMVRIYYNRQRSYARAKSRLKKVMAESVRLSARIERLENGGRRDGLTNRKLGELQAELDATTARISRLTIDYHSAAGEFSQYFWALQLYRMADFERSIRIFLPDTDDPDWMPPMVVRKPKAKRGSTQ